MIQADYASGSTQPGDENHVFDLAGNKVDAGFKSDVANRTIDDGNYTYEYDAEGNRTQRTLKGSPTVYTEYQWDHRGRLVRVTDHSNLAVVRDCQ